MIKSSQCGGNVYWYQISKVDTIALKSFCRKRRAGSIPAAGTKLKTMQSKGQLKLIQLTDADEILKLETDIYFEIIEPDKIIFKFNFDFEEITTKGLVVIDDSIKQNTQLTTYAVEIISLSDYGFILKFILNEEADEDGGVFVCTAVFKDALPEIGFIKRLLYHFKF